MEWDPEGDAGRAKEGRARLWLTLGIVIAIAAFAVKQIYQWQQGKQRREAMEHLSRPPAY